MKIRFIIVLLGILIPATSFAGFPSFDPMNFGTNISENIQTVLSKIENSQQVITMQKTLAKIGSVKSSISDFINKAKDVANKAKEKFNKYKELGQKYVEKAKAYAEMAKKVVNTAKDIKEQGLGNYLKDNAGELAGGLADKVGLDGSKIGDIADKAASGDFKGLAGDMVGDLADKAGLDGDKISGIADGVMSGDFKGIAGDMAGNLADKVGLDGDKISGIADGVMNGDFKGAAGSVAGNLADKVGVDGDKVSGLVDSVKTGVLNNGKNKDAADNAEAINSNNSNLNDKLIGMPDATPKRQAIGGVVENRVNLTKTTPVAGNVPTTLQSVSVSKSPKVSSTKVATTPVSLAKISATPVAAAPDKKVSATSNNISAKALNTLNVSTNKAVTSKAQATSKPVATSAKIEAKAVQAVGEVADKVAAQKAQATSKPLATSEKISTKAASTLAVTVDKTMEKNASSKLDSVATKLKASIEKIKTDAQLNKPDTTKKIETVTPKRVQFKSSFGYGKMQSKHQLYFASLGGDTKTGSTPEGLLVVPESVSLNCQLNYEDATKDKKMDTCLKSINKISMSEVTEDVTKGMIDDALKDVGNGYIEYLTVTYFEALNAYNESLTFKNNELDPVMTTSTNDIDASWRVAKEMHIVLGERINKLRQLWARVLGMKMYSQHANERFVNEEK